MAHRSLAFAIRTKITGKTINGSGFGFVISFANSTLVLGSVTTVFMVKLSGLKEVEPSGYTTLIDNSTS